MRLKRAIIFVVVPVLMPACAGASERYVLHRFRDAICKMAPCPNWSGTNLRTGETIEFDVLIGADFASKSVQDLFDRHSRDGKVLVDGDFTPLDNRLNLTNWSSVFSMKHFIRNCSSDKDCEN